MKHPILYRVLFYSILLILCGSVLRLSQFIANTPFSSYNMRSAYYNGCIIGTSFNKKVRAEKCSTSADTFKEILELTNK